MESRLIYIANKKMRANIQFAVTPDYGWVHFGAQPEVNIEIVKQKINHYFEEESLYVAHSRNDSIATTKKTIIEDIRDILGVDDFSIWNSSFTSVIDFNKIGVLRCGKMFDS
jgi:hypothetical protein